jgi:outer membrane protein assembly factor BamE (lipoprotein component of BamABCDE complex)
MKRISVILLSLFLSLHFFACTTPQSRREELQNSYPAWNSETLDKVSRGVIELGMNKKEVRETLASTLIFHLHPDGDRWTYVENSRPGRQEEVHELGKILIFQKGRLAQIRTFLRSQDRTFYLEW